MSRARHDHRTSAQLVGVLLQWRRILADVGGQKMVGNKVAKKFKPEERNLRQHPALVRDAGSQHVIECGDAIGGHKQQPICIQGVDVADFSAGVQFQFGEVGLQQNGVEKFRAHE